MVAGEIGRVSAAEQGDIGVEAPLGKGQKVVAISSTANVDALAAKHAAERIVGEESEVDFFVDLSFKEF